MPEKQSPIERLAQLSGQSANAAKVATAIPTTSPVTSPTTNPAPKPSAPPAPLATPAPAMRVSTLSALSQLSQLANAAALGVSQVLTAPSPALVMTAHDIVYSLGFPSPPADGGKFSLGEHQQAAKVIAKLQREFDIGGSLDKVRIEPVLHVARGLFTLCKSPVADTAGVTFAG